jgi:small GTP-binding protein
MHSLSPPVGAVGIKHMMSAIPTLKVVIAGNGSVGKTSLIRRYCEGKFAGSRVMTIGVDFQTKLVDLPSGTVKLSIWDMAGQERFAVMRTGFYRGSRAAALVYDVTHPASLADLEHWRAEIIKTVPNQKFIVIGNKVDLRRKVDGNSAADYARQIDAKYVETSAASGAGVPEMFDMLAQMAVGPVPSLPA